MLRFYLMQSALGLLQMDAKTTLNLGNILLVTWVDRHIKLMIIISHLSISEIVVHGRCYISLIC